MSWGGGGGERGVFGITTEMRTRSSGVLLLAREKGVHPLKTSVLVPPLSDCSFCYIKPFSLALLEH